MNTLNQHIYFLKKSLSRGEASDDHPIQNSEYKHAIDASRSTLLKRRLDNKDSLSSSNYQSYCIDLIDASPSICDIPEVLIESCKIKRSVNKIPNIINSRWGSTIKVQFPDGRNIPLTNLSKLARAQYALSDVRGTTQYFIRDNYLFITGNSLLQKVQIESIFEDPTEATDTSGCVSLTDEYPLDSSLYNALYEMCLNILMLRFKIPEDTTNNASDTQGNTIQKA